MIAPVLHAVAADCVSDAEPSAIVPDASTPVNDMPEADGSDAPERLSVIVIVVPFAKPAGACAEICAHVSAVPASCLSTVHVSPPPETLLTVVDAPVQKNPQPRMMNELAGTALVVTSVNEPSDDPAVAFVPS